MVKESQLVRRLYSFIFSLQRLYQHLKSDHTGMCALRSSEVRELRRIVPVTVVVSVRLVNWKCAVLADEAEFLAASCIIPLVMRFLPQNDAGLEAIAIIVWFTPIPVCVEHMTVSEIWIPGCFFPYKPGVEMLGSALSCCPYNDVLMAP